MASSFAFSFPGDTPTAHVYAGSINALTPVQEPAVFIGPQHAESVQDLQRSEPGAGIYGSVGPALTAHPGHYREDSFSAPMVDESHYWQMAPSYTHLHTVPPVPSSPAGPSGTAGSSRSNSSAALSSLPAGKSGRRAALVSAAEPAPYGMARRPANGGLSQTKSSRANSNSL